MKRFVLVAAAFVLLTDSAEAFSCRDYLRRSRVAVAPQVEGLVRVEDQILYRLAGARVFAYDDLSRSVRSIAANILPPKAAIAEQRSRRCRNWIPPVRRVCRDAALRLAILIDEMAAGGIEEATRAEYTNLITRCETWLRMRHRPGLLRSP